MPRGSPLRPLWLAALRHPWATLILAGVILPWLLLQARNLQFEPRIDLLSPQDPLARAERARRAEFGPDFRIMAALMKPYEEGGIMGWPSREALRELHQELEVLPGVLRASSLVNAPALVATTGSPAGQPLWTGSEDRDGSELWRRVTASLMERFILSSLIRNLTPVYLETDPEVADPDLVAQVRRVAREVKDRHPDAGEILVVGPAVVGTSLSLHVFDDLVQLVPLSIMVVTFGLFLMLRNGSFVLVAILHCLVLVAIVLGGMAALGLNVNLVSVLAPVILVPVGVADLLHLFVRLRSGVDASSGPTDRARLLESAYAHLERAMVGTSATTALGFLGFLISPVAAVRQFGLTMSAGSVIALLITFTLDAALLTLIWRPRARAGRARPRKASRVERVLLGMIGSPVALRRRSAIALACSAVLASVGLLSLLFLEVEDTWIRNFDPDSRVARDIRRFEQYLFGSNLLSVVVRADPSVPGTQERAIATVNELSHSFFLHPGARGALSTTLLARSLDPNQGIPWRPWPAPSPEQLARALEEWRTRGLSIPRIRMLNDPDLMSFQVLVFVLNRPYGELVRLSEEIRDSAVAAAGDGVSVSLGGDLAANIKMVRAAVDAQGYSLLAVLGVLAVLTVSFTRSVRSGMILVLPMILAILVTYAVLIVLGIPYGIAVSMFPPLIVGLSIDFAIHLRAALVRNRDASRTRSARDLAVVVRGILLNGALWTAGFAVLTVSHLPPNRYLGLLSSLVIALSTVATLALIPTASLVVQGMARSR